jgi:hypothetical protein
MIPYEAFKALPVAERDAICAKKMGWIDLDCGYWYADSPSGAVRTGILIESWSPTTDRNDAAMMVENVAQNNRHIAFDEAVTDTNRGPDRWWRPGGMLDVLLLDPCLIAYCSCVALEEA